MFKTTITANASKNESTAKKKYTFSRNESRVKPQQTNEPGTAERKNFREERFK
jgi:hypothetical protein